MQINEKEIQEKILHFIGDEGYAFFKKLKDEHGRIWCVTSDEGFLYSTWSNEGRQIRNYIIDEYPDIVEELGGYGKYEDWFCELTENMFQ
jgi:hypothetical protein